MPAIVGPVQVMQVSGGVVQFGDSLALSPKSASKTFLGSGASNTGAIIFTANGVSGNNVLDLNGVDQPIAGNN
ncbi:spore germination protein [Peribacillus cavernae]|uniref:Spore germination protein n=1 Tax=Peribacillus cavernae TaxID=1674310 RepID=A0A3S0TY31_9BACI|nr:spore germination protein [Peribacillus cavernae]MDQ0217574.1 spore germination protein PF [Peribacillus cavernae]RUQ29992.1 spore germination protein [Peribacillus cavernae]